MSAPLWFAHRLNDWSKLAKERVKRATDGSQDSTSNLSEKTSTSSDDGSTQKEQKSANSSFEVQSSHYDSSHTQLKFIVRFHRNVVLKTTHRNHRLFCNIKANHFHRDTSREHRAYQARAV